MVDGITAVQVEALVAMKIIKHASQTYPSVATGSIVGMEVSGNLEVTNCFAFPSVDIPVEAATSTHAAESAAQLAAAAAPRAVSNVAYQNEMIKMLREVNVDSQNVGWYTSTNMGNFINANMIENQYFYQKTLHERTIALIHDVSRSTQGALSLRAYRLSSAFMSAYAGNKFTVDSLQKSGLRYQDILVEIPIRIHNSHLITSLLHQLPTPLPTQPINYPNDLSSVMQLAQETSLEPNLDSLDLCIDPFLEKSCDLLLDSIEAHHTELNNHQYYHRSLAREQAKITAWQAKRKAENASRTAAKQPLLPEDEWQRLFKLPQEPSRLDVLLNSRQVEQYARQVDGFTASVTTKMFAVKSNLLPGED